MKKHFILILVITALAVAGYYLHRQVRQGAQWVRETGDGYSITDGTLRKEMKGFIELSWQKKRLKDGFILYRGTAVWNKISGAPGIPAKVPVQILRVDREAKRLEVLQTFLTGDDGRFFFIVPEGVEVMLGVRTERALNMPTKVRQFLEVWKRARKAKGRKI